MSYPTNKKDKELIFVMKSALYFYPLSVKFIEQ